MAYVIYDETDISAPKQVTKRRALPDRLPADVQKRIDDFAERIPADVRKHLSAAELCARMTEVERIKSVADKYGMSPIDYRAFMDRADAVTKALAASTLNAQVAELRASAATTCDPLLRRGYYERIRNLEKANPQVSADDIDKAEKTLTAMAKGVTIAKMARRR